MEKATQLTCLNCKHTEDYEYTYDGIENMNFRKNSKIYMPISQEVDYDFLQENRRENRRGIRIHTMLCFACKHLTNFTSDVANKSGKAIGGIEYFETFKYDSDEELKYESNPTGKQVFNYVKINIEENDVVYRVLAERGKTDKTLDHVIENLERLK